MAEIVTMPMPLSEAEYYLSRLIDSSGAFLMGSKPNICRLRKSYAYGKVHGIKSFDNQVVTRIDYDPEKGYHFNFVDHRNHQKICILISDMTEESYRSYIDRLNYGRFYAHCVVFNVNFISKLLARFKWHKDLIDEYEEDYADNFEEEETKKLAA